MMGSVHPPLRRIDRLNLSEFKVNVLNWNWFGQAELTLQTREGA